MTDQAPDPVVTPHEQLEADYARLWRQHTTLVARLRDDLDRTSGAMFVPDEIPLDVLADCLPYSGAGPDEAAAVIRHLADDGWWIVPTHHQRG